MRVDRVRLYRARSFSIICYYISQRFTGHDSLSLSLSMSSQSGPTSTVNTVSQVTPSEKGSSVAHIKSGKGAERLHKRVSCRPHRNFASWLDLSLI